MPAKTRAARPAAPAPHSTAADDVLEFSSAPAEPGKREVLFRIDAVEYTIPVEPPASIALRGMEILAEHNGSQVGQLLMGRFMFTEMLGAKGYAALLAVPDLKAADYAHLVKVCSDRAMAAIQGEDGSPN